MRAPSNFTMAIGHPLVATPVVLGGFGLLYVACLGGPSAMPCGLSGVVVLAVIGRAHKTASAYRAWRREWLAMAGEPDLENLRIKGVLATILFAFLIFATIAFVQSSPRSIGRALGWVIGLTPLWLATLAVWMMVRRKRDRSTSSERVPVKVVAKALLPAPPLADAYAALPEYCQRLLGRVHATS